MVEAAKTTSAEEIAAMLRDGLDVYVHRVGVEGLRLAMEIEVRELCGARSHHDPARQSTRYGSAPCSISVLGVKEKFERPRVRSVTGGGEVVLNTYVAAENGEVMDRTTIIASLCNVSQRNLGGRLLPGFLGGIAKGFEIFGASRSSVGRRFIEATQLAAESIAKRPIEDSYPVLFIDAVGYADHLVICVLGVNAEGKKRILGLRPGSSENHLVVLELLEDLRARGLRLEPTLVVLDGGKGLRKAVEEFFGANAVVQRCRVHKSRNVEEKLPEDMRQSVHDRMWRAYALPDADRAQQQLTTLAHELNMVGYKEASTSLLEGLEETLTVNRLGLDSSLRRLLGTTNVIESAFSISDDHNRRVKRWQGGSHVLRWVAIGLLDAEHRFARFASPAQMRDVTAALAKHAHLTAA
ncbi:MAG: IS256 family transposase [Candidatus Dormibacteria bacterium]